MESQSATVIAISGDRLTVRVDRAAACSRCAAGRGCGAGLLDSAGRPRVLELDAPLSCRLRPGDTVDLKMRSQDLLRASLLAYGVPLSAVLLTLAALKLTMPGVGDGPSMAAASLSLVTSFVGVRRWLRREPCVERLLPRIDARLPGS